MQREKRSEVPPDKWEQKREDVRWEGGERELPISWHDGRASLIAKREKREERWFLIWEGRSDLVWSTPVPRHTLWFTNSRLYHQLSLPLSLTAVHTLSLDWGHDCCNKRQICSEILNANRFSSFIDYFRVHWWKWGFLYGNCDLPS